jgi:hypothetical protein
VTIEGNHPPERYTRRHDRQSPDRGSKISRTSGYDIITRTDPKGGLMRTLPVLFKLMVTFNTASGSLGNTPGIEPPVACLMEIQKPVTPRLG